MESLEVFRQFLEEIGAFQKDLFIKVEIVRMERRGSCCAARVRHNTPSSGATTPGRRKPPPPFFCANI